MIAYNAALCLAAAALQAAGFKARGEGHHATLFETLPLVMTGERALASYFDDCRRKRNTLTYAAPMRASGAEAAKLLAQVKIFSEKVEKWLAEKHPRLLQKP